MQIYCTNKTQIQNSYLPFSSEKIRQGNINDITRTENDRFITKNNKEDNKKIWKYLLGLGLLAALIAKIIVEIKAKNKAKAETEAVKKAKKDLEDMMNKEKKELEKKLQEEKEKWDKFINNTNKCSETNNQISKPSTSKHNNGRGKNNHFQETGAGISEKPHKNKIDELRDLQEKSRKVQAETNRMLDLEIKNRIVNEIDGINGEMGLAKVIGYEGEKQFFQNRLIQPILQNKENNIPNIILLYGPKGTGKTFIANSVAEEAKCNTVILEPSLDYTQDLKVLKMTLQNAEKEYCQTNKRTIIRIDEFDSLINNADKNIIKEYKTLFANISKKYHATIIATTNNPANVAKDFMNPDYAEKLYIPPVPKQDLPKILKHYADCCTDSTVNYEELSELLIKKAGENAYSNAKIASIIQQKVRAVNNLLDNSHPRLLTQKDLIEAIQESSPDISREILNSYQKV